MRILPELSKTLQVVRPFALAIDTDDPKHHRVIAMNNAYIEILAADGHLLANLPLFRLNEQELTLESFRLKQKLLLSEITADRLSEDYVNHLILDPMNKAIKFAKADFDGALDYRDMTQDLESRGVLAAQSDQAQEIIGLTGERHVLLWRAQADLIQKQIEIDGQRRRLAAEQDDLKERIELNDKLSDLHKYSMPRNGVVEFETYNGAFLKREDHICTIRFD